MLDFMSFVADSGLVWNADSNLPTLIETTSRQYPVLRLEMRRTICFCDGVCRVYREARTCIDSTQVQIVLSLLSPRRL